MTHIVRKADFAYAKTKAQVSFAVYCNCEADQRLCFRYCNTDSTIPLLSKSKISGLKPSSVNVQPGLCRTFSETQIVDFFTHMLIYFALCYSSDSMTTVSRLPGLQIKYK